MRGRLNFPGLVLGFVLAAWVVEPSAAPPPRGLAVHAEPRDLPNLEFRDGTGDTMTLRNFRGKVVVLNLWATWCPPCREEMPTLDALQRELGGAGFQVVALSIDRAGPEVVRSFYKEIGIEHLKLYIDSSMRVMGVLGIAGIPTTLVIGPQGQELGRLTGSTDWASRAMLAYFEDLVGSVKTGNNNDG